MAKHRHHQKREATLAALPDLYQVQCWSPDEAILTDGRVSITAAGGSVIRRMPCVVCARAVGGAPFIMHHLTFQAPCATGFGHLTSATVLRHEACHPPADHKLATLIMAIAPCLTS